MHFHKTGCNSLSGRLLFVFWIISVSWLLSCTSEQDTKPVTFQFTASGITITGLDDISSSRNIHVLEKGNQIETDAIRIGNSLSFEYGWSPGQEYSISIDGQGDSYPSAIAPRNFSFAVIDSLDMGRGLLSITETSQEPTITAAALAGDAGFAVIGNSKGEVKFISLNDFSSHIIMGKPFARIISLEIYQNDDENIVFIGEQSPRGTVSAYKVSGEKSDFLWSYDTSQDVGLGIVNKDDPYSWAHLPGIYNIKIGDGGQVLVLSTHSRITRHERVTKSILYKFSHVSGEMLWKWPESKPLDATSTWFSVSDDKKYAAVCSYLSDGYGIITIIDCETGRGISTKTIPPLEPHVKQVNFWRSVDISDDGGFVYFLADDGRAWIWNHPDQAEQSIVLSKPILTGDMPLMTSGAGVFALHSGAVYLTGVTYLPWDMSSGQTPQQPHPQANKAFSYSSDGKMEWTIKLPGFVQGIRADNSGNWLLVSCSSDPVYSPEGFNGVLSIGIKDGRPEITSLLPIEGSILMGSPFIDDSGKTLLLVEVARRSRSGESVNGRNAVHILRW